MPNVVSILSRSAGKRYAEFVPLAFSYPADFDAHFVGITPLIPEEDAPTFPQGIGMDMATSVYILGNFSQSFFATLELGDVVGIAVDLDQEFKPVWISVNGVWAQGDPVTGDNPFGTMEHAGPYYLAASHAGYTFRVRLRVAASDFDHAVPAGFVPWDA